MPEPLISVIVAEKNSARTIRSCLDSLLAVAYPRFEIIIVDDGSTDDTPRILASYAEKVRLILEPKSSGPSSCRNTGATGAAGGFIAFTDGDCVGDRGWLSGLASGFVSDNVASVGGSQAVPDDESRFGRVVFRFLQRCGIATDYVRAGGRGMCEVEHNPSCNSMYRRELFLKEGGFARGMWPGEDVELDYRLRKKGLRIMFNPLAVVKHYRPSSFTSFCRMMARYGWAQGVLVRRYGMTRTIQFAPVVSAAVFVFLCVLPAPAAVAILLFLLLFGRFDLPVIGLLVAAVVCWNAGFVKGILYTSEV
jgi:glycosyltransferase involved in cell wall biosynthesis